MHAHSKSRPETSPDVFNSIHGFKYTSNRSWNPPRTNKSLQESERPSSGTYSKQARATTSILRVPKNWINLLHPDKDHNKKYVDLFLPRFNFYTVEDQDTQRMHADSETLYHRTIIKHNSMGAPINYNLTIKISNLQVQVNIDQIIPQINKDHAPTLRDQQGFQ